LKKQESRGIKNDLQDVGKQLLPDYPRRLSIVKMHRRTTGQSRMPPLVRMHGKTELRKEDTEMNNIAPGEQSENGTMSQTVVCGEIPQGAHDYQINTGQAYFRHHHPELQCSLPQPPNHQKKQQIGDTK